MLACRVRKSILSTSGILNDIELDVIGRLCNNWLYINVQMIKPVIDALSSTADVNPAERMVTFFGDEELCDERGDLNYRPGVDEHTPELVSNSFALFSGVYDDYGNHKYIGCSVSDIVNKTKSFYNVITSGNLDECPTDYWVCDSCCRTIVDYAREHHNPYGRGYICNNCHENIEKAPIKGYSYRPHPRFVGIDKYNMYIGAEIEVNIDLDDDSEWDPDCCEPSDYAEIRSEAYDIAAKSNKFVYCKFDRSVGCGFEIVTHPFTYGYELSNGIVKSVFDSMSSNVRSGRSDGVSSCGVHLHVSKEAIPVVVASKIANFMVKNKDLIESISHRTDLSHMRRYASLDILEHGQQMSAISNDDHRSSSHYSAFHVTKNTYEFRIFNGTRNYEEFMSYVEFVVGVAAYFRQPNSYDRNKFLEYMKKYSYFTEQNKDLYVGVK